MSYINKNRLFTGIIKVLKHTLIASVFVAAPLAYSQTGIKAGVNFAGLRGNDSDGFKNITNFHIGFVSETSIFDNLSLQAELLYSGQGAEADNTEYKLNYINVPLLAKFYLNDNFNIQIGPQAGVVILHTDDFKPADPEGFDFGFAGGVEFMTTEGLFVQGRYNWGTLSVIKDYDIKNSVIQLSVGYMF